MKIGFVYTDTTPELIATVEREVRKQLGSQFTVLHYEDPSILSEIREHGFVTSLAAARLISLFLQAVTDGAAGILNICSSVGDAADCVQDMARYLGVPIVRIDEEMCRHAVRTEQRIGVLATLPTTLEPTRNTLKRVARESGRRVILVDGLIDGAFGISPETFKDLLLSKAMEIKAQVDVIILAQGSMAFCENHLHETVKMPVLSSPRFGAAALKAALLQKGEII